MNEEQFNEIKERLARRRRQTGLNYKYYEKHFFEYILKTESLYCGTKNDTEKVNCLVNIYIFLLNTFDVDIKLYHRMLIGNSFKDGEFNIKTLIEATAEYIDSDKGSGEIKLIPSESQAAYIMCGVENMIKHFGFDFYKCIIEKIKEVESRIGRLISPDVFVEDEGYYNIEEVKKKYKNCSIDDCDDSFIVFDKKGHTKQFLTKFYKANYENCKLTL